MSSMIKNLLLFGALSLMGGGLLQAQPSPSPAPAPAPASPVPFQRTLPLAPAGAVAPQAVAPAPATNGVGPKIQFADPIYDFGRIRAGDIVKYSYIFTNIGNQVLEVTAVQPGCGCTTAGEWTKKVEPGQVGQVPIQFNSHNFNGQVAKTISVRCNDPAQANLVLQLKGTIWRPLDFIPQYAVLNLPPDVQNANVTVRIVNNTEEFVTLSPPEINNPSFQVSLATNTPGKEYTVTVATVPPLPPGTLQAQITVKTSSTNTSVLTIPLWVNVQPAITVMPPAIALPPPPLQTRTTPSLTIQCNSTNALALSEPAINIPGVEVQMSTLQTGRVYTVSLAFPQGFELPQGQTIQFTAATSLPQVPLIRVPVTQMPRPVVPPTVPPMSSTDPHALLKALPDAPSPAGKL
jgi:hypothetical protein